MLFAVPIPEEHSLLPETINDAIEDALKANKQHAKVTGKDVTPYLLSRVAEITGGRSLQSSILCHLYFYAPRTILYKFSNTSLLRKLITCS